jgi:cellulose synthase/poly-beta-1,6-N-acetylglucosamine synthase-like glycosyltransferase
VNWFFWASAGLIAYTYVGYPIWLWVRSRISPKPVLAASFHPPVSIVMVVRNEENCLDEKLTNLLSLNYPAGQREIIVVSDCSTDATNKILDSYALRGIQAVLSAEPQGKAAGLNRAVALCQGEVVIFTDARQIVEPQALEKLIENFADPNVGCVSGELMLGDASQGETAQGMGLYWRIEKQIRELESLSGSVVGATGALYAVRRSLFQPIPRDLILDDVLIPMQVVRQGQRALFEPSARAWDSPNLGGDREFKRKVRTLTGNYQLLQVAPWLLSRQNPIRFEFVSHKLLRLLIPFALLTLLVSSALLSGAIYRAALILQLCVYALSGLALARLNAGPVTRIADAALTFVVLNMAAAVAFANFVSGRKAVWVR